ncbi:MAG TPA: glycosyltransferase family 4 protein [Candidatus Acidoferrales bacterium]|jgi:glycosyltransferase involved in cell wall biosynthesis|nr:glycosyltransferase family 4 protein [Candidatus Acidoferrales bacterium]
MKLLIFAHTPPPYHGQSVAVKLMLEHFGGDRRKGKFRQQPLNSYGIECYHVNARFSKQLEDVGELQFGKILLVLFYCLQAIWCRLRYGVETFFYIPAPGKPIAVYRDWLVMLVCRPFFKRVIFNWRAAGMAKWLETSVQMRMRSFTYQRMKDVDLSIVLSSFSRYDAEKLMARKVVVVAGGISDPCPEFETEMLPRHRARIEARKKILAGDFQIRAETDKTVNVIFVALCIREKGVYDSIDGVALANEKLAAEGSPLRFRLTLIGPFASDAEEKELRESIRQRNLENTVTVLGFVSDERKKRELSEADIFCFPSYHVAEGQPASLMDAFAFGLPSVTTRWRAIPEMFAADYPGFVDSKSPAQIAEKLRLLCVSDLSRPLREIFLRRFTLEQHLAGMAEAMRAME